MPHTVSHWPVAGRYVRIVTAIVALILFAAPSFGAVIVRTWKPTGATRYLTICWADAVVDLPASPGEGALCSVEADNSTYVYHDGSWVALAGGAGLSSGDIDTSAELRGIVTDEVGTGALMFGLATTMEDGLACGADQVVKRNGADNAFECGTISGGDPTLTGDVDGLGSANDLDEANVETELEGVLDLENLQGAVTDSQVPNSVTVDLATTATTATTANSGDSATAFFSSGTFEDAIVDGSLEADEVNPTLGSQTQGNYVSGVTANQGLLLTGTEGATLGFIDCAAGEALVRNGGDTAWECATVGGGSGLTHPQVLARLAVGGGY